MYENYVLHLSQCIVLNIYAILRFPFIASHSSTSGFISHDKKISTTSMGSSTSGGDVLSTKEMSEALLGTTLHNHECMIIFCHTDDDVFALSLKPIYETIAEEKMPEIHNGVYKEQESNQSMDNKKRCTGNDPKKPIPLPNSIK